MKVGDRIWFSYDDIVSMCCSLKADVAASKPSLIVGITRGGLVPALHLSHSLELPLSTIQWQTRDGARKEIGHDILSRLEAGENVAFIDDINDTGKTFHQISLHLDLHVDVLYSATFASLIKKTTSSFQAAPAALTIQDDRWLVFPWERQDGI